MKPPRCSICEVAHWLSEGHQWPKEAAKPAVEVRPVVLGVASNGVANKAINDMANTKPAEKGMANSMANKIEPAGATYRYRDAEARRVYQRELMRKRRAGFSGGQTSGG